MPPPDPDESVVHVVAHELTEVRLPRSGDPAPAGCRVCCSNDMSSKDVLSSSSLKKKGVTDVR